MLDMQGHRLQHPLLLLLAASMLLLLQQLFLRSVLVLRSRHCC